MIPFADALHTVLANTDPSGATEEIALLEAYGRTLGEELIAQDNIPIADNSAMDGYAVRHEDVATEALCAESPLSVLEVIAAEHTSGRTLGPRDAMKIMTGAPIPAGADAVVMVEHTRAQGNRVWIDRPAKLGQHIRPAGGDMRAGQHILQPGTRLGAAHVGLLASLGHATVRAVGKPKVGILATGNELVNPDQSLESGKVRNANSYTLCALAEAAGAEPIFLGIAEDDRASLKSALTKQLDAHDVLITSGGVSMGDFDYVKQLVQEIGLEVHFREVNVKPGKPVVFGTRGKTLFFGLPGNPVSTMVSFQQLVRPALRKLLRAHDTSLYTLRAVMDGTYSKSDGKRHFLRGVLSAGKKKLPHVRLTGKQDSNILLSMGQANCFVVLEEKQTKLNPGDMVDVQLFEGATAAPTE